jgi:DNA-binding response OmpR family regulator
MSEHGKHTSPQGEAPASSLVLVVEDDEPIALALMMIVEDEGYNVLYAHGGQEALEMARRYHPALIFTDLMMPRMNGAQLISALRASGESRPHMVIMTAAATSFTDGTGADALLKKPFDIREVELLLHRFLEETTATSSK